MRYTLVAAKTPTGYSAYAPDLPGFGTTGSTLEEIQEMAREGIEFHIDGLKEAGLPIPDPTTAAGEVEVAA